MASDWESIEKSDSERWLRLGFQMGVTWTVVGVLGVVVVVLVGRPERWDAGVVIAAIGVSVLVSVAAARRARRRDGRRPGGED